MQKIFKKQFFSNIMIREYIKEKVNWYIYILHVDNYGKKGYKLTNTKCYYTGITLNLGKRMAEHIYCLNNSWLTKHWFRASKKLVYVEYLFGNEYEAIMKEKEIKKMSPENKAKLINSPSNQLVSYRFDKKIISINHPQNPNIQEIINIPLPPAQIF